MKTLKEWNTGLYNIIIMKHPKKENQQSQFIGVNIYGKKGVGKSTYAYKIGAKIYYTLNGYDKKDDEENAYKESLKNIIFEPTDLIKFLLKNKIKHEITPYLCLDDACMHFSNMLHNIDQNLYYALKGEMATIRSAVTAFVITAQYIPDVAKIFRDYNDIRVEIKIPQQKELTDTDNEWTRIARYYSDYLYPDLKKKRVRVLFQDKYDCYIPDEYYKPYLERKRYFEIKHGIEIADRFKTELREMFIQMKNELPRLEGYPDLKKLVEKWEQEEEQ